MKPSSPLYIRLLAFSSVLAGLACVDASGADAGGTVLSPTKRQEVVDKAKKLLAPRTLPVLANDPFHPTGFDELVAGMGRSAGATGAAGAETAAVQPTGPRNDRELLRAIGEGLRPSGFFVIGGQPTLVFGQKRVKAEGSLTITFEGSEYTLEISDISPPNFTLRLNREEFTRTIK